MIAKGFVVSAGALVLGECSVLFAQASDGAPFATGGSVAFGLAAGTAAGTALAVVIKAIGDAFWKPWLESRSGRAELERVRAELIKECAAADRARAATAAVERISVELEEKHRDSLTKAHEQILDLTGHVAALLNANLAHARAEADASGSP